MIIKKTQYTLTNKRTYGRDIFRVVWYLLGIPIFTSDKEL